MSLFTCVGVPCAYSEDESGTGIEVSLVASPTETTKPPVKVELVSSFLKLETQSFTLEGTFSSNNVLYYIYDTLGVLQVASSGTVCHGEITISEVASLPSGQYTLVIEDGESTYEYVFVK